ncbi:hypothetical protein ACMHYB_50280 [Sorangium sp. So ce1128]
MVDAHIPRRQRGRRHARGVGTRAARRRGLAARHGLAVGKQGRDLEQRIAVANVEERVRAEPAQPGGRVDRLTERRLDLHVA